MTIAWCAKIIALIMYKMKNINKNINFLNVMQLLCI